MNKLRNLTQQEIQRLEHNGCTAEDWSLVTVGEGFDPDCLHRVVFYGTAQLGRCTGSIEVSHGFVKRCGINNATLRNVVIGDNCLIENIGNFMNNVTVGDQSHISNVCPIETTTPSSAAARIRGRAPSTSGATVISRTTSACSSARLASP